MFTYTYSQATMPNLNHLENDVKVSDMVNKNIQSGSWSGKNLELSLIWDEELSSFDKDKLDVIVLNNDPTPDPQEEPMTEIILHKGKDRRLKIWGVNFTAVAGETTEYDFVMPFTAAIQYGKFFAGEAKTGDRIWMIIAKNVPGMEYAYVDGAYITKGGDYKWGEEFGTSSDLPEGLPLQVKYQNTDTTDKTINFNIELRLPD